jgi:murein DD-endopeptidase MepM/ murein hydrolase activator NlpD
MWTFPLKNHRLAVPSEDWHPGRFGFKRRFDYHHTGVDLYAKEGDLVFAVENGTVVGIENFTGEIADTPWWNDTWALLVEGESGVIVYGEVCPVDIRIGDHVTQGQPIAKVLTVLKELQVKDWIPGHSRSMLHFELHQPGTRKTVWWKTGEPRPKSVQDPTEKLKSATMTYQPSNFNVDVTAVGRTEFEKTLSLFFSWDRTKIRGIAHDNDFGLMFFQYLDQNSKIVELYVNDNFNIRKKVEVFKTPFEMDFESVKLYAWNWLKKQPSQAYGSEPDMDGSCYKDAWRIKSSHSWTGPLITIKPEWSEYHK